MSTKKVAIILPDKALCGREGGGVGNNLTRRPPSQTHPPPVLVGDNMALVPGCP